MDKYIFFFSFLVLISSCKTSTVNNFDTEGMILIGGGSFKMGSDDIDSNMDERPVHSVEISSFWMDETEVTNAEFKEFVDATGYITTAEKSPDWEELKKDLPPNTPKPDESVFVPASLVFKKADIDNLSNHSQWWEWKPGANWKNPGGPGTNIEGKENHPVVQISWFDANAYAQWKGRRLPTEAEWEYASRGGLNGMKFSWGNEIKLSDYANTWEGEFPKNNYKIDGYESTSPVKVILLINMDYMIWQEMCGSGVATFTIIDITNLFLILFLKTQLVQPKALILLSLILSKELLGEVVIYVTNPTVQDTEIQ